MGKIKLFVWGDAVTPTGFSRVLHSITGNLPKKDYDISWLGVNYRGDPNTYKGFKIYPATAESMNDLYGLGRVKSLLEMIKPDIIFLLNDAWILDACLNKIKETYKDKKLPKIVTYIPVDAIDHDPEWYKHFDVVTKMVAYTNFGRAVISQVVPDKEILVIPHGVDKNKFFKINDTKENIKKQLYPKPEDYDPSSFIVLNASRNQPRKRLDLTMQGFAIFAKDKPSNVKLYMHCGIIDSHINVVKLAMRYGIQNRLIVTNRSTGVQTVPDTSLNLIYNATDVGLNTSIGEGWCLPCIEHAVTGAPQVVPGHSALLELYNDCGKIIPCSARHVIDGILTTGFVVNPIDIAQKLEELYSDRATYDSLSVQTLAKFTKDEYSWVTIAKTWDDLFKSTLLG